MSLESWQKEYLTPKLEYNTIYSLETLVEQSIKKWTGLSNVILKDHGLSKEDNQQELIELATDKTISINASQCQLCALYSYNYCSNCPLAHADKPCDGDDNDDFSSFEKWMYDESNAYMLNSLIAAKEKAKGKFVFMIKRKPDISISTYKVLDHLDELVTIEENSDDSFAVTVSGTKEIANSVLCMITSFELGHIKAKTEISRIDAERIESSTNKLFVITQHVKETAIVILITIIIYLLFSN